MSILSKDDLEKKSRSLTLSLAVPSSLSRLGFCCPPVVTSVHAGLSPVPVLTMGTGARPAFCSPALTRLATSRM
ncbi:hypothetical protein I79_002965 [Cricetulus griseus]|uniref:Uncharacterized protein n=1 Tax=Cricetulus griseus TaxID=10029 RepID=G3GYR0_CRIGR|nr:hypothetical protein I79_002965 [Cricetulus griseus]